MKTVWLGFVLFASVWLTSPCRAASPRDTLGPVNCAALRERLAAPRWLSLPDSRLVVNPFLGSYADRDGGSSGGADGGVLPVSLAYYVGAGPVRLPAFWSVQPAVPSPVASGFIAGPRLDLSRAADWQASGVTATFADEEARVAATGDFGAISRTVTVDLDKTPTLLVQTPPGSPAFDMKVNSGSQPVDVFLKPTNRLGAAAADVAAATGWRGVQTFKVLLYALGKGKPITFTRVQFFGLPAPSGASEEYAWMPHEITSQAQVGALAGPVGSAVTLPDVDSVAQRLHIGPAGPSALLLAGQFPGSIQWDAARRVLLLQGENFRAVLSVSRHVQWLGVRPTQLDWADGTGPSSAAGAGVWRMGVTGLKPGDDVVIAAHFSPVRDSREADPAPVTPAAFAVALRRNEAAWDQRLARVPRPRDFTPRRVDPRGVTALDVRRSYYRAWVFFYADTLPPMPENGFPYPQVCTGKPSLWTDGGAHTEETALWDASATMQALALVTPQTVWAAAQGVMSQVDSDGYLHGEALPTIFARTVWLLYQQTGDLEKLRGLYPALKRFLLWKIANPRWIYPNRTKPAADPNADKDQEFVSHEIVDMQYAIRIAGALALPDDVAFWRQEQRAAAADYQRWFWPIPGGRVYRIYVSDTDRNGQDDPWNLQGLQIDPALLPPGDSAALVALYKRRANPALPFLVPGRTRFGDLDPIARGLFQHGQAGEAAELADACLRDVTRADEFAEDYTQSDPPVPNGVRPSSFGARLMVDSVFRHNGVLLDEGLPVLLGMPGAIGVDNIPVHGDALHVRFDAVGHTVALSGPALARLRLPDGFRVSHTMGGETLWTGPVPEGRQIPLTAAPPPGTLAYVAGSTKRVCQLTGDFDPALGQPTLSRTGARFGVIATDLGSSFGHRGRLFFLFGDTVGRAGSRDAVAWTKTNDPQNIRLDFYPDTDGKWLPLSVPGVDLGAFEVPSGGVSVGGRMYVVVTTDWMPQKGLMGRSVLAVSQDDGRSFRALYDLSTTKFINVSFWQSGGWLYIFGSGAYRRSSVCLARIKLGRFPDRSQLSYFAGVGADRQPRWSPQEQEAAPLFQHDVIGEFSVAFCKPLGQYIMLYNSPSPRGIILRSSVTPYGPWSDGIVIFDPWRDGGYGDFMHIPSSVGAGKHDTISDPQREAVWGGEYGPYLIARFTTGRAGRCRLFYTMSTWNPYQVVVMQTDLRGP